MNLFLIVCCIFCGTRIFIRCRIALNRSLNDARVTYYNTSHTAASGIPFGNDFVEPPKSNYDRDPSCGFVYEVMN